MARLEGKCALVSGAARGIGEATARLFAAEGARVVIGDLLDAEGEALARSLADSGAAVDYVHLDVTSEADWKRAVAACETRHGALDVLVNNAGVYRRNALLDTSAEEWDWIMDVNAKGVFLGTRAAIPAMRRAGGGSIVNLSSIAGLIGSASSAYNASKGAVRLLTKVTAVQHGADGIRCNSVHPAPIDTAMGALAVPPEVRAERLAEIPLGRFGRPDEVARAILFLACDESTYVTGSELVIDGGLTAR